MGGHTPKTLRACALVAALALAGCGSSAAPSASTGAKTSPTTYADHICTAVGTWVHTLQDSSNGIAKQIAPGTPPARAKEALQSLLSSSVAASEAIVKELHAAGTPEVANGDHIATSLLEAFEHATTALAHVRETITRLPTSDRRAFLTATKSVSADVRASLSGLFSGLAPLRSPALQKAAATAPACATIGAG